MRPEDCAAMAIDGSGEPVVQEEAGSNQAVHGGSHGAEVAPARADGGRPDVQDAA